MESRAADDHPNDEVAFWRGFITWWARVKTEPVPPRAWEALAFAQRRAAQRREQQDEREDWIQ
ncbi:hypothetical protein [Thiohalocapsa sp.]|uniref:hypothetical protein n=1 Tax=Thiohalocapsa sp. TaxID=2497641 RepID=UPI0025ECC948|nr:hypothetical protein [Thiohalocapsa sp.]